MSARRHARSGGGGTGCGAASGRRTSRPAPHLVDQAVHCGSIGPPQLVCLLERCVAQQAVDHTQQAVSLSQGRRRHMSRSDTAQPACGAVHVHTRTMQAHRRPTSTSPHSRACPRSAHSSSVSSAARPSSPASMACTAALHAAFSASARSPAVLLTSGPPPAAAAVASDRWCSGRASSSSCRRLAGSAAAWRAAVHGAAEVWRVASGLHACLEAADADAVLILPGKAKLRKAGVCGGS